MSGFIFDKKIFGLIKTILISAFYSLIFIFAFSCIAILAGLMNF